MDDLPLKVLTPASWAQSALSSPLALLNDHAHLERKAATNALGLLTQWPEPEPPEEWVTTLCSVAKDEAEHLAIVTRLLARRGGELTKMHRNAYATALRRLIRLGLGKGELVDRLLVSALIELRSCERFKVLAENCPDEEMSKLYKGLWASEHGHYRIFLRLANRVMPARGVKERFSELLEEESRILQEQPAGPSMHSGF